MVRDGIFYGVGLLLAAAVVAYFAGARFAVIPLLAALFFFWFFRDPERVIPAEAGAIVSPADGKITIHRVPGGNGQEQIRLSIFLSIFDVHVNRAPIAGVIRALEYHKGEFCNAMDPACSDKNEQNIVTIQGEGASVVMKQIAGLLARRIVFRKRLGESVARGERVGIIKFGSRTDLILPHNVSVVVKSGDRVKGGSSVLARLLPAAVGPAPSARKLS